MKPPQGVRNYRKKLTRSYKKKEEGRRKKEEGRRKKEEGRRKKAEGRRKKEEGRRKKEQRRSLRGRRPARAWASRRCGSTTICGCPTSLSTSCTTWSRTCTRTRSSISRSAS